MKVVGLLALNVGGLVAMMAALSFDIGWLALIILPFWIAGLVWVDWDEARSITRARYERRRR